MTRVQKENRKKKYERNFRNKLSKELNELRLEEKKCEFQIQCVKNECNNNEYNLEICCDETEKRNSATVLTKRFEIRLIFIDEDIDK